MIPERVSECDTLGGGSDPPLLLRPLRDDPADHRLLARWLADPRLLEWYHGRDDPLDEARVREEYGPLARGEDPAEARIAEAGGVPVGYVQCWPAEAWPETRALLPDPAGAWGIDYFLEPERWHRGLGVRMIGAMTRILFEEKGASRVVSDPRIDNPRSVRVLEKAGFRRVRILPAHEMHEGAMRDCVLMERLRP